MANLLRSWILAGLFLILSLPVYAASRYTIFTEVVPDGKKPVSKVMVATLAGDKGRIDIVERDGKKEAEGLFLMTLDGGKTSVLGHKQKTVCSTWDSQEYFREMGRYLHKARHRANLEIADVNVEKVREQPGPELLGYATTHLRLVTTAGIKASVLMKKFQYTVEVTDDIWLAPQLEIHPIERQWINAQTNTGFKQLDLMMDSWNSHLPTTILKQESVIRLKDLVKKKESTKTEKIEITSIEKLEPSNIPEETFLMPKCKKVSRKEMENTAKEMFLDILK
jgi:hypothetical protein